MKESYKSFTARDLEAIRNICGADRVIHKEEIGEDDGFKTVMTKIGLDSPFEKATFEKLKAGILK